MKFLRNEIARFFALGFAGGAALVLGTMGVNTASGIASGIVPTAHAAVTR